VTEATRRLFVALWPHAPERGALALAAKGAVERARAAGGRPVLPHDLHCTLCFLGAVAQGRVDRALQVAAAVADGRRVAAPDRVGRFVWDNVEAWSRARVLCATSTAGDHFAEALAAALREAYAADGFRPDVKPFRPHVTLARKVSRVSDLPALAPVTWRVDRISLVESAKGGGGESIYSVIDSWPLYKA
jgi:2'-5' RNA ligase